MATKRTPTQSDFFDAAECIKYEKPRWQYQKADPIDKARSSLEDGS